MAWQTRASRTVYDNRWISVREDAVTGPSGDGVYGVVTMKHPAVFVVALDDAERVCLVTIQRYTTGRSVEVPAGGSDGEDPLRAAQRELREETGLEAEEWAPIGVMNALNGIAVAPEHVFLARGLRAAADSAHTQAEEGIDDVFWVPFGEALQMAADGRIADGETIAALAFAGIRLGRFR
ncbi:NUDIX hydrolase [Microbacterium capsulatum]|uniref:NUDIX hydrolase n=1 Tax=Microbacterium capsulatum TaxID=3041921 RepID=A0ABU0XBF4_9MICO|nr:NUDIX hydrolase [Microbacterium sp. ASV81]MDQ4212438.1 NUDIX hydrolase [Microbacterium sp. ASV81]